MQTIKNKKKSLLFSVAIILALSFMALPGKASAFSQGEDCIGSISIFSGNFAPRGWAFCHGQMLAISQNQALYSIIGNYYGGDGRTIFALPDLRGRAALGAGAGPGLTNRQLAQKGGEETHTLTSEEIVVGPVSFQCAENDPENQTVELEVPVLGSAGAHNNMQPHLVLNYIICLQGIYPSRSW